MEIQVAKFTLSSGKEIYLREPLIEDTEKAAQVAGKKAGNDNQAHLAVLMQKEMLKLMLMKVNDQELKLNDKEQLQKHLTMKEYNEAVKAMNMLTASGDEGNLAPEWSTTGGR